jgi:hypothetical protein
MENRTSRDTPVLSARRYPKNKRAADRKFGARRWLGPTSKQPERTPRRRSAQPARLRRLSVRSAARVAVHEGTGRDHRFGLANFAIRGLNT